MLTQFLVGLFALAVFLLGASSVVIYFTGAKEPTEWKGKIIKYVAIGTVAVILLTVCIAGAVITGTVLLNQIGF